MCAGNGSGAVGACNDGDKIQASAAHRIGLQDGRSAGVRLDQRRHAARKKAEIVTAFYDLAAATGVHLTHPEVVRCAFLGMLTLYRDADGPDATLSDLAQHLTARRAIERLRSALDDEPRAAAPEKSAQVIDINRWRQAHPPGQKRRSA